MRRKRPTVTELLKVLLEIEEISEDAQSLHPKADWKQSHDAVCFIYRLAHAAKNPKCMSAHPDWLNIWKDKK